MVGVGAYAAAATLDKHLPRLQEKFAGGKGRNFSRPELKPVARRVLRHVARGRATTVEALMCFAYFFCRIPQRKPLQRLQAHEHYARFRYADFQAWTGVHRATQSRLLIRLMERGFINTLAVHKQNENVYGQLFIDGPMLSLVRRQQEIRRRLQKCSRHQSGLAKKKSTPVGAIDNTPQQEKSTLRNLNPKTEIRRKDALIMRLREGTLAHHGDNELRRIALRAVQIEELAVDQAA